LGIKFVRERTRRRSQKEHLPFLILFLSWGTVVGSNVKATVGDIDSRGESDGNAKDSDGEVNGDVGGDACGVADVESDGDAEDDGDVSYNSLRLTDAEEE
jgi:hypothetical protein